MLESSGTLLRPKISRDSMKGVTQSFVPIMTGIPCSVHQAGASTINLYAQRNTTVSTTIYLAQDIEAQVNDRFDATDRTGKTTSYLVRGGSQPVARGVLWTIDAEKIVAPT